MLALVHIDKNNLFYIQSSENPKLEATFIVLKYYMRYSYTIVEILEIIENEKYEIWVKEFCWG